MSDDERPEPSFSVDLRGLAATLAVAEDGEPTLIIGDDQGAVAVETGAGGSYADAIEGAEQLAERAAMLVSILRIRAGDRAPLKALDPSPDEVQWWIDAQVQPPVNGTQSILP